MIVTFTAAAKALLNDRDAKNVVTPNKVTGGEISSVECTGTSVGAFRAATEPHE